MLKTISLDLTNENTWLSLSASYKQYELEINNTDGSDVSIKLSKGQIEDLLKEFLHHGFFEVDEDGEVCIAGF